MLSKSNVAQMLGRTIEVPCAEAESVHCDLSFYQLNLTARRIGTPAKSERPLNANA